MTNNKNFKFILLAMMFSFSLNGCLSTDQMIQFNTDSTYLGDNRYRITSGTNFSTNHYQNEDYSLLVASEATINHGKTFFVIEDTVNDEFEEVNYSGGGRSTSCDKEDNICTTTYTAPSYDKERRKIDSYYIKMLTTDEANMLKARDPKVRVYDALQLRISLRNKLDNLSPFQRLIDY